MRVAQISVLLKNELGVLSEILKQFTNRKINILGLTINESASFGELRLIVDDIAAATLLLKEFLLSFNTVQVLVVELDDKPGQLMQIAMLLSENEINVDYIYTLSAGKTKSYVAIKAWNMDGTEELLREHGMNIVSIDNIKK